ncbi:MAG: hypothetical protein RR342_01155 [Bacilli bacterium]
MFKVSYKNKVFIVDSISFIDAVTKVKDAHYILGGYPSKDDKMLKQDIAEARAYGVSAVAEKVGNEYQLVLRGSKNKLKSVLENYFGADSTGIIDTKVKDLEPVLVAKIYNKSGALLETKKFSSRSQLDNYVNNLDNFYDMSGSDEIYKNNRGNLGVMKVWKIVVNDKDINDNLASRDEILVKCSELMRNIDKNRSDKAVFVEFETPLKQSTYINSSTGKSELAKIHINLNFEPDFDNVKQGWYIIECNIVFRDGKFTRIGSRTADTAEKGIQALRELLSKTKQTIKDSSEENNWTYIMHGTTGDFKVDNLTKERAEYLLKNNRGLGYDGEIIKETTNKIVKDFDPIELRNVAKNCNGSENKDSQGYIGFTFRNTNDAEKFEDWLVKNKYQYNTNGYKYYVEIEDKSVFSKETLNSIQNGIEQDFEEMKESREELHDESIKVNSVDELVSKIRNWNGENITYFYKPWDRIWYFTTVVTLGSKYNYYGFIDKTLTGRHENPNVDLKKQEVHEKVYSKDIEELKQKVINILK